MSDRVHILTEKIESAVKEAILDREPAKNITAPLLNMLARVLVGTAKAAGTTPDELLDIAINELTEATAFYATHDPKADRQPDPAPRD